MGIRMALLDLMPAAWKHGELLRASQKGCEEVAELLAWHCFVTEIAHRVEMNWLLAIRVGLI